MKLLLDTQLLLWAAGQPDRLSADALSLVTNPEHELIFSAASLWEVVIKRSLGREDFHVNPQLFRRGLLDNGYQELAITSQHVMSLNNLPLLHKDPFDRMLIAQAISEGITLVTADVQLARYSGPVLKV
jgi:PIN domain nuclease of toxin-antitoxin system